MKLDALRDYFVEVFPQMDLDQQRLALDLYRLLATGETVEAEQLARSIGLSQDKVRATLDAWPGVFFDDAGCVIGFWGIALAEMPHRMRVNGHTVFAWCAWDTLFIPQLLDQTVRVDSVCPVTGEPIALVVTPDRVEAIDRREIAVSFLTPEAEAIEADVTTSFCHFVHFFASRTAADEWVDQHPGSFLLTLDEAFRLGDAVNRTRYDRLLDAGPGHAAGG